MSTTPRWLTVAEAAPLLGVGPTTVYQLCAAGDLPHCRVGAKTRKKILLTEADVRAYLDRARFGPDNPPGGPAPPPRCRDVPPRRAVGGRPDGKPMRFIK